MSGTDGNQQQALMQISEQLEDLQEVEQELEGTIDSLKERQDEIDEAIEAVQELQSGDTVMVPLSEDVRVRATLDAMDEIIVDIGGGYAVELGEEDAVDTLESKKEQFDEQIDELEEDISEVQEEIADLEEQAQQLQMQMQQQQMQEFDEEDL